MILEIENETPVEASTKCSDGVARLDSANEGKLKQFIFCRTRNARNFKQHLFRLDFEERKKESPKNQKYKQFVYSKEGLVLGTKKMLDDVPLVKITLVCNVKIKSQFTIFIFPSSLASLMIVGFVIWWYRISINVSLF